MRRFIGCVCLIGLLWGLPLQGWSAGNVLFILDASGSMKGKLQGQVKMDAAKSAFRALLAALPKDTHVGLEVYGHRGDKDCSVIELMNPVAPLDTAAVTANVDKLHPVHGATPMAEALKRGGEALKNVKGKKAIVLISDGKENCGGDPAAAAAALRKQGIDIVTHVVGLGVNEDEKAQLAAIAKAGGGRYYAANNAEELKRSLAEVSKRVIQREALFRDDFEGAALSEQWEVVDPDPELAIVEDGYYQMIAEVPKKKLFTGRNMLLYKGDLPKEYEIEARVLLSQLDWCANTKGPFVGLVLKKDEDNAIALLAANSNSCDNRDAVHFLRVKGGKWQPGFTQAIGPRQAGRPVRLKIQRIKRKFIGSYSLDGGKSWKTLGSFSALRMKARLGLISAKSQGNTHPMLEKIDWVELRKLQR